MKKKYTYLLGLIITFQSLSSQTILHTEGFESDGEGTAYKSNTHTDNANDFWLRSSTSPEPGSTNNQTYTGFTGSFFWNGEDVDSADNPLGEGQAAYVVINTLDISSYAAGVVKISIDIAGELNGSGSWETDDFFGVEYAFDTDIGSGGNSSGALPTAVNTGTYTIGGGFYGNNTNNHISQDNNLDGSGDNVNIINNTFTTYEFEFSIPTTASNMSIRIRADLDQGGEVIAFDQIVISASLAPIWSGTTNTNWDTATNWSTGAVPTALADVSIPSGLTNYPIASSAVTVNSVTIASGATLIAENTFSGTITYNRNLATTNWYLVSSPVSGETIEDLISNHTFATGTGGNIGLAPYDNAQANMNDRWDYQTTGSTGSVTVGKGYSVKLNTAPSDISFTGALNTSDVSIALAQGVGGGGDNFNLLGNPFTSFINSSNFLTSNTSELTSQTIWLWNQATGSYDTKVTADAFKIAPGQGFFVQANTTNNVTFAESIQSHETTDTFQRNSIPEIHVYLKDEQDVSRYAKIYYYQNATTGFDNGYDGELFGGVQNSFEIYSHLLTENENKKYQIQSLPDSNYESMVIPLGVKADAGKEITFSVETMNLPTDLKVFLEDKNGNIFTRLDEMDTEYTVTLSEALDGVGRFYIHTSTSALSIDTITLDTVHLYTPDVSTLRILGLPQGNKMVKLFNLLGKQILHISFDTITKDISLPKLATGIYSVQIQTEVGKLNRKIVLE